MNVQLTPKDVSQFKYVILGNPIAWARPGKTKYCRSYDTQQAQKEEYGWHLKIEHKGLPLFTGPLHLDIVFYMPLSSTAKNQAFPERIGKYHDKVPDLDNMIKFICDAIQNDILITDDKIIVSIVAKKVYDLVPRTEFYLMEIR